MMKKSFLKKSDTGTVLILVLWALGLLTVFAVHIGARVQQKIHLLSRLDKRARLHLTAVGGVQKARAVFHTDLKINGSSNPAQKKRIRFNNPDQFHNVKIGRGTYTVSYQDYTDGVDFSVKRYGFVDEERKININKADAPVLKRLIPDVTGMPEEEAESLANAIVDWRKWGHSEIVEFYSDEYYENLEFPYEEKKADFETPPELLLVKGMTKDIYDKLSDFVTIYGEGKVNINTASRPVLSALDIERQVIDKILLVRRGQDGVEATADDFIFADVNGISADLSQFVELEGKEVIALNKLGQSGKITTQSFYFRVQSQGQLDHFDERKDIACVFYKEDGRMIYWREQ